MGRPKKLSSTERLAVPGELVERKIYLIRGHKVMLDADLAALYQVPTKRLNEAVRRNLDRFPEDFMFQLTDEEAISLRSQFATTNTGRGGRRYLPYAFTEHGLAMLSSVLSSARAVQMNIVIVRAFVRLREVLATHRDLADRIEHLDAAQKKHASVIAGVVKEIKKLSRPARRPKSRIGFVTDERK